MIKLRTKKEYNRQYFWVGKTRVEYVHGEYTGRTAMVVLDDGNIYRFGLTIEQRNNGYIPSDINDSTIFDKNPF